MSAFKSTLLEYFTGIILEVQISSHFTPDDSITDSLLTIITDI